MRWQRIALGLSLAVLVCIVLTQVFMIYETNGKRFIYPLDDTYIHLAIAKNIVSTGTWGINNSEFSSSSSSILYTLLLTAFRMIVSPTELAPLILNIFSGTAILYLVYIFIQRNRISLLWSCFLYLGVIFFSPLPAMIISGMEHTLQILIDILYIIVCQFLLLKNNEKHSRTDIVLLSLISLLATAIRYEGIFLTGLFSICFILRGQNKAAFYGFISSLLPIVLFGLYSISNNSYFLPNGLLLKGNIPTLTVAGIYKFIYMWIHRVYFKGTHLMMIMVSLAFCLFMQSKHCSSYATFPMVLSLICLIIAHTMFAGIGWFYRYDAYLVALGLLTWSIAFHDVRPDLSKSMRFALVSVLCGTAIILAGRGVSSLFDTVPAANNIYEQQIQMARFVRAYYNDSAVALNDIGSVAYFTDSKVVDLYGLGCKEVVAMKRSGKYTAEDISRLARSKAASIAILYERWFSGKIPAEWTKVGQWSLSDNVVCGDFTVTFYAIDETEIGQLSRHLLEFGGAVHFSAGSNVFVHRERQFIETGRVAERLPHAPGA